MLSAVASLADAYLMVGVYVAALFFVFGWIRMRWAGAFERLLLRGRVHGPAMASLAALPPGCIGVLAFARMYVRGDVTYGSVVAALVSTMGDAAWLLLVETPRIAVALKLGLFVVGLIVGYTVDRLGIAPSDSGRAAAEVLVGSVDHRGGSELTPRAPRPRDQVGRGSCSDDVAHQPARAPGRLSPIAAIFWGLVAIGVAASLPATLQIVDEEAFGELRLVVGAAGFAASVLVFLQSRGRVVCGEEENEVESSMTDVLRNGATEAAFVTFWVALIFGAWDFGERVGWVDPASWELNGLGWILVAALVGLIPACGVEVLVSAMFVSGVLPFPALLAYLVSQDGNGLIPIASRRPRAAAHATVLTTVVAVSLGAVALLLA